jgi:Zn-dependent protease
LDIIYGIGWYIVFILSVTFHEAAHAWAAKRGGDLTAYSGGQVSLNPWPHIKREPLGMVVLPIITVFLIGWPFGYAKTPYDPLWAYKHPRKAAWMAAAGPAANLLLMVLAVVVIKVGILTGFFVEPYSVTLRQMVDPATEGRMTGIAIFVSMLFSENMILFILNLIPLPPLDGSGVISLFLSDEASRKYKQVISFPAFALVGLLLAWWVFTPLFDFVFVRILNIIYWGAGFA